MHLAHPALADMGDDFIGAKAAYLESEPNGQKYSA
jgi:hypothetical protein